MVRRFVAGNRQGELQFNWGETARQFRANRKFETPKWWKRTFPIVYELVPISLEQVKSKAAAAKGESDATG